MINLFLANVATKSELGPLTLNTVIYIIAFLVAMIVGGVAILKKLKDKTMSGELDLVDWFINNSKEMIIDYMIKNAFEEDAASSVNYGEFKQKCITKFIDILYPYIQSEVEKFPIPDNLKMYFNKETVHMLTHKVCDLPEVDEKLGYIYDNVWAKKIKTIEETEEEHKKVVEEIGDVGEAERDASHLTIAVERELITAEPSPDVEVASDVVSVEDIHNEE